MILPDINLLLYAYNPQTPQHVRAATWWESVMGGEELIGLPDEVSLGFVRIATNPKLGEACVSLEKARAVIEDWLALPHLRVLVPGADHFAKVLDLTQRAMGRGPLISDATLAVYALENRATLHSNDTDFARFPELDWVNPLEA